MTIENLICPQCGAPLSAPRAYVRCPYCGAELHVTLDGADVQQSASPAAAPAEGGPITGLAALTLAAELGAMAQNGQVIEAIKRYRQRTGEGLTESKSAVEKLMREPANMQIVVKLRAGQHSAGQIALHGQALADAVDALLDENDKIGAVKLYRQGTGVSLAEANQAVRLLAANRMAGPPPLEGGSTPSPLESSVRALLLEGKKIDAIKLYRERTSAGLKESKDAVDGIAAGLPPDVRQKLDEETSLRHLLLTPPCLYIILAVLLLIGFIIYILLTGGR